LLANSLKQILQRLNFRKYPRFLPHFQQRLTALVENLGFFFDLAIVEVFAIFVNEERVATKMSIPHQFFNLTLYINQLSR